mmetsp:Transcript_47388/g.153551  ORF Transcript_47388/g.153551 Transcript_47388/m.153551 type:complete len:200 (-) Transcript_47388:103-702(-)
MASPSIQRTGQSARAAPPTCPSEGWVRAGRAAAPARGRSAACAARRSGLSSHARPLPRSSRRRCAPPAPADRCGCSPTPTPRRRPLCKGWLICSKGARLAGFVVDDWPVRLLVGGVISMRTDLLPCGSTTSPPIHSSAPVTASRGTPGVRPGPGRHSGCSCSHRHRTQLRKDSVSETWASYTTFVVEHNGTLGSSGSLH